MFVEDDPELDMIRKKKLEEMRKMSADNENQEHKTQNPKPQVIVYSTSTCPYCTMAKDYLSGKGVKFEDVNVSNDRQRAMEMIQKSGQMGVPVLDIKGKIIVGFDRPRIDAALSSEPTGPERKRHMFNDPLEG
jgi:glutaredoxin-like YruB-family protein